MKAVKGFIAFIFIVVIIFIVFVVGNKKDTSPLEPKKHTISEQTITELKESNLLKSINLQTNEAFVDPYLWTQIDYKTKQNFGVILATYCEENGPNKKWVYIKDNMSGKTIAKYDAWGFSVE